MLCYVLFIHLWLFVHCIKINLIFFIFIIENEIENLFDLTSCVYFKGFCIVHWFDSFNCGNFRRIIHISLVAIVTIMKIILKKISCRCNNPLYWKKKKLFTSMSTNSDLYYADEFFLPIFKHVYFLQALMWHIQNQLKLSLSFQNHFHSFNFFFFKYLNTIQFKLRTALFSFVFWS